VFDTFFPYDRKTWVLTQVVPPILDVGCGPRGWIFNDSRYGEETTYLDLDTRKMPNFITGDAHSLPFGDQTFSTVAINELLEHVQTPKLVVGEAFRVARLRVVLTVPCEHLWPPELKPFAPLDTRLREEGLSKEELYRRDNPDALTMRSVESRQAWHARYYDDESILRLLEGYDTTLSRTHHPGGWVFYSGVIRKRPASPPTH
jgi:SAM-dependent methyltransferase